MTKTNLYDFRLEYLFQDGGVAEIDRQLALLLSTRVGTIPLDREFGLDFSFLDMPTETAKSLYTAEVTKKVAKFIPGVRVAKIEWDAAEMGAIKPRVVITSV